MRKIKIAAFLVVASLASFGMFSYSSDMSLSDLQVENVEALTNEGDDWHSGQTQGPVSYAIGYELSGSIQFTTNLKELEIAVQAGATLQYATIYCCVPSSRGNWCNQGLDEDKCRQHAVR